MAEVIPFKKKRPGEKHKGNTLCKNGFHKWERLDEKPFDSRQGKLVTAYRCKRCGIRKNKAL